MSAVLKLVLSGFAAGLAVGLGAGLLLAPASGESLRGRLALEWRKRKAPTQPDPSWSDEWTDAAEPEISTHDESMSPSASDFGGLATPSDTAR